MNLFAAVTIALLSHGIRANAQGLVGEYPYIIKYVADDKCLAFDIRRHGFSGQGICGLTTSPGDFIANKQAVWRLQPLGGDQYLLKNAVYPDKCLIMSDNGHAQHPQFHNWENGPDFCGFPGGKDALIANKQAVWHLEHFRDDMYLIKNDSNRPGECLWFGNNGADEYPSRFLGHAENQLCGREGAYGNPTWMIQKVPPAAEHTIAICEGSEPVAMAVNESSNVVYVRCTRPGGAGLEDRVEAIDAAALDSVGRKTYPVTQVVSLPTHADGTLADRPSEQLHFCRAVKAFFNWLVRRDYIQASPVNALTAPQGEKTRDRVLAPWELELIWQKAVGSYGAIIRLCILLGTRKSETTAIQSEWIQEETLVIPASVTKNRTEHILPLTMRAKRLAERYAKMPKPNWNSWNKDKKNTEWQDSIHKVTDWTIHDLRRTFATVHAQIGTPPHIIERLLNHKSGVVSGVSAIYNRYHYLPQMREALDAYERYLEPRIFKDSEWC